MTTQAAHRHWRRKTALGESIQGVHHVGITVQNMDRAFEFYTEILGGTGLLQNVGIHGDAIHNTLLLYEEMLVLAAGVHPHTSCIPDLRSGSELFDICYVQLNNLVVELLHYRQSAQPSGSGDSFAPVRCQSSPAHPASTHLGFWIVDEIDLNRFVLELEKEANRRGMTNVRANRTVFTSTDRQRTASAPGTRSFRTTEGEVAGLSLMYCKGPEGEQLEFVQLLGSAKKIFQDASKEQQPQADKEAASGRGKAGG